MENNAVLDRQQEINAERVLKQSALIYFKQALKKQQFEACRELVTLAREFGADSAEVQLVITSYLTGDKPGGRNQVNKAKYRLSL
jgi:hypothetical protein